MKQATHALAFLLLLISCSENADVNTATDSTGNNNNETSSTNGNDSTAITGTHTLSGCYMRVLKRDTLAASLQQRGNNVTGKLTFDNYEKDGSTGSVNGTIEDGILKLTYTFQSEGMNSVMQVFFRLEDDGLTHGTGEVAVRGDSAYFTDPVNISYSPSDKLRKISCDSFPAKYKE